MPSKRQADRPVLSKKEKKEAYVAISKRIHLSLLKETAPNAVSRASPNFEYTLTFSGVSVSLLDINSTIVSPIRASGKVFADRGRPFYIEVRAHLESPNGTGNLQLKDISKSIDVFASPEPFTFGSSSNGGLFLEDVKLP